MSLAEDAAGQVLRRGTPLVALPGTALYRLPLYAACTALALVINYAIGKEMAWDTLHYHLYAGFSAVSDRFSQDYFAAGPQGYANPYAYMPFYAMVRLGLPALLIGSLLALVHSMLLWLTFELALVAYPPSGPVRRTILAVCAVALAATNPVLIQQIGSSFADITTAELVLAGWILLAMVARAPGAARVILAGVLLGAAAALKLTNAVHALAAIVVLLMLPRPLFDRIRAAAIYGLALGLGFALVAAPWSYRLEKKFGNPFFPFLNTVFRSPEFTTEPMRHFRFIPSSLGEALWRPIAMLNPVWTIHEELRAPDLRYALLLLLICVLAMQWLRRRLTPPGERDPGKSPIDGRVLAALGAGFAVDWVGWLFVSGNSRYFIPMACVASVLVIGVLFQVFAALPKVRNYVLTALFALQSLNLWIGTDFRWKGVPWDGGKWFEIEVPGTLATTPALYLTLGAQSNSFVVPYLAREAGVINFSGQYPLDATQVNGEHVRALIRSYAPNLRVLTRGERLHTDAERGAPRISEVDGALELFRLRVEPNDCATILVHHLPPELEVTFVGSAPDAHPAPKNRPDTTYLVSCSLVPRSDDGSYAAAVARQQAADVVFDRLEDACPALFQPRRVPTDMRGNTARRIYFNTDLTAWISNGWVKFGDPIRADDTAWLGHASDWQTGLPRLACGRRDGHYFARLLEKTERPAGMPQPPVSGFGAQGARGVAPDSSHDDRVARPHSPPT
jgi:hypothetical protein